MIKLYKTDANPIEYAECWLDDGTVYLHFGQIGDTGTTRAEKCDDEDAFERQFSSEFIAKGFCVLPDEKKFWMIIQWPVKTKAGKPQDLEKRDTAIHLLNEGLGWVGLGEVDGWDIGRSSGPIGESVLNIACIVVDETVGVSVALDSLQSKVDFTNMKIATRPFTGENYSLRFSSNKADTSFFE